MTAPAAEAPAAEAPDAQAPAAEAPVARTRSLVALFTGVASLNTASVAAATVGTLIASDSEGAGWSGVPNAAAVLGTALGSLWLGVLISRRGRRSALRLMYAIGVAGGLVAFAGAANAVFVALLVGMALLGLGNSAANLSRYAAAALYPEERKGFGISVMVWAGTVGALAGPGLIAPAASAAERLHLPGLSGPLLVAALLALLATAASATLPREVVADRRHRSRPTLASMRAALRRPGVRAPLTAMAAAHAAMVGVMTMTPLQLHHLGHGLGIVGLVLSAHMVGMFVLAPLSGRIADRWGGAVAIRLGVGLLALAAILLIAAPAADMSGLPLALFLLGYGWNLVFVGGSSLLSHHPSGEERDQLQGAVDALVWGASVFASLAAGQLFGLGGYRLVAMAAGGVALTPLLVVRRRP